MMERAGLFDGADDFDASGFTPKRGKSGKTDAVPVDAIRAVSEASNFQSREPARAKDKPPAKREPRRYRTGRNMQLNLKARAEAIEAFYAIADGQGWVLGETLERAVAALARELGEPKGHRSRE